MKPKYRKGPVIRDPMIVFSLILSDQPVFMHHKCQNASWARGWQIGMIINSTHRGAFAFALPIEDEAKK